MYSTLVLADSELREGISMTENFFDEQVGAVPRSRLPSSRIFRARAGSWSASKGSRPQYGSKLQYIDLFAGPGRYKAVRVHSLMILERRLTDPEISSRFPAIFNDKDQEHLGPLEKEIKATPGYANLKNPPQVYTGEVGEDVVKQIRRNYGSVPTFVVRRSVRVQGPSLSVGESVIKDWGCDACSSSTTIALAWGWAIRRSRSTSTALSGKARVDKLRHRFHMTRARPSQRKMFIVDEMRIAWSRWAGNLFGRF